MGGDIFKVCAKWLTINERWVHEHGRHCLNFILELDAHALFSSIQCNNPLHYMHTYICMYLTWVTSMTHLLSVATNNTALSFDISKDFISSIDISLHIFIII